MRDVLQLLLDSEVLDVSHVTVTTRVLRTCSVTRSQDNVCVTLLNQHLAGGVTSASQDSGTSPTADSASAMVTLTHVTLRLESASTAETTPWVSSATSVR